MKIIALKDALQDMERMDEKGNPIPFTVEFVTCDEERETGGEFLTLENVVLAKNAKGVPKYLSKNTAPGEKKAANEWENATRNFLILSSNQIRKCNVRLITAYNGQQTRY